MRNIFIGFLFLVAIWIGWGAPVPGVRLTPMTPDPGLGTFQRVTQGETVVEHVPEREEPSEDQLLRRLNERVVNAAHRLEAFPCDAVARRELRMAVAALFKEHLRRVRSGKDERAEKSGSRTHAGSLSDDSIDVIITDGVHQGVLQPEDLGAWRQAKQPFVPVGGFDVKGRFVCEQQTKR